MFEDFDSLDMYGFLDYLEESSDIKLNDEMELSVKINKLEESYGIYEDINGNLQVEENALLSIMENYNMNEDEAFVTIIESYEEELENLLENDDEWLEKGKQSVEDYQRRKHNSLQLARSRNQVAKDDYDEEVSYGKKLDTDHIDNLINQKNRHKEETTKNAKQGALAGAAIAGVGIGAHKLYKAHKAKQRRNKGFRGKLRRAMKRFREDYSIYEENGQLYIENEALDFIMEEFDLLEEDALDIITEELLNEYVNRKNVEVAKNITHGQNHGKGGGGSSKNKFPKKSSGGFDPSVFTAKMAQKAKEQEDKNKGQVPPVQSKETESNPQTVRTPKSSDNGAGSQYHNEPHNTPKTNITKNTNVNTNNKYTPEKVKEVIKEREPEKKFTYVPKDKNLYSPETVNGNINKMKNNVRDMKNIADETEERKKVIRSVYVPQTKELNRSTAEYNSKTNKLYDENRAKKANYDNVIREKDEKHNKKQKFVRGGSAAAGALGVAGVAAGAHLAHKAYKKHQENKRKNRGIRGMVRRGIKRLREDYGIYEENGQLFIENEMLNFVMDEYDLYEEDAIDLIMESYEIEEEELYSEAEEIELYSEGIADYDPRKMKQNAKNFVAAGVTHKLSQAYGMDTDETRNAVKTTGKALAKSAALPAAGTIAAGGATALAYRALKKRKGKKFNSKKRRRK